MKLSVYLPESQELHAWAAVDTEYEPAPHAWHSASPYGSLYEPAAQGSHGPPSGPVKPPAHLQSLITALLGGLRVNGGHAVQTDVEANVFAGQPSGALEPPLQTKPWGQRVHVSFARPASQ